MPHRPRAEIPGGWMKWVDSVSLGNVALSTSRTRSQLERAASLWVIQRNAHQRRSRRSSRLPPPCFGLVARTLRSESPTLPRSRYTSRPGSLSRSAGGGRGHSRVARPRTAHRRHRLWAGFGPRVDSPEPGLAFRSSPRSLTATRYASRSHRHRTALLLQALTGPHPAAALRQIR